MLQESLCVMAGKRSSHCTNALSPGIEPRHTAPEADALSIELGELYTCNDNIVHVCQDILSGNNNIPLIIICLRYHNANQYLFLKNNLT